MRLMTFQYGNARSVAAMRQDHAIDLHLTDPEIPNTMRNLLAGWPDLSDRVHRAVETGAPIDLEKVEILAPVPDPPKVICIGLNYADHAAESGVDPPEEPVVFCKFPSAVTGPDAAIELPACSTKVDYEAELVVVMGRGGRNIAKSDAMSHVAGYTCGHDVSARDWQLQKPGGQWLLGKTFDSFAPMGPCLVTRDEIAKPGNLDIRLRLNGKVMQDSNTEQLIYPIDELIAYVSQVCTLESGDVIFTGTPPGVGGARKPPVYLENGDITEVEIERIGTLRNPVVRR